jgi:hypothetical protein
MSEKSVTSDVEVNIKSDSLSAGDEILVNDRKRPLTVTDRHQRDSGRRGIQKGEREELDIVELSGNGTEYHLLWKHGSGHEPILRRRSQWTVTDDGNVKYSAQGDRVHAIEIVSEDNKS